MNPLMWLRLAGVVGIIAVLAGGYWYIDHQGYKRGKAEVQTVFDKYKGVINDQVQAAKIHAEAEKKLQDAKYESAKHDYADSPEAAMRPTLQGERLIEFVR